MINIVIPMAGAGSRFANNGYLDPKPLIQINGKYMIEGVIENLTPNEKHRFIFICQKNHLDKYNLAERLKSICKNCIIIPIQYITKGAACTVLLAREFIDSSDPLMIANSDQWIDQSIDDYLSEIRLKNLNGLIMTMYADNPKWSFVKLNENNLVTEVVEKKVISNEATVGIYNFQQGKDFCNGADLMISSNKDVNGEYYVAPVFNELMYEGFRVGVFNVGSVNNGMYGLGTPTDLEYFLKLDKCKLF
jgi:dTDP-glucose pyrophosphorylase